MLREWEYNVGRFRPDQTGPEVPFSKPSFSSDQRELSPSHDDMETFVEKRRVFMTGFLLENIPERLIIDPEHTTSSEDVTKNLQKAFNGWKTRNLNDKSIDEESIQIFLSIYYGDLIDFANEKLQTAIEEPDPNISRLMADQEVFYWRRVVNVLVGPGPNRKSRRDRITPFTITSLSGSA